MLPGLRFSTARLGLSLRAIEPCRYSFQVTVRSSSGMKSWYLT